MFSYPIDSDITILGAGVAGTATLIKIIEEGERTGRTDIRITILEKENIPGPGLPYALDQHATLRVNDHIHDMLIMRDKREDFANWVKENLARLKVQFPSLITSDDTIDGIDRFPPRCVFGMYCQQRFEEAVAKARSLGITINVETNTEVTKIQKDKNNNQWLLETQDRRYRSRNLVIAAGHLPSTKFSEFTQNPQFKSSLFADFTDIPKDKTVVMMGSGLSAIDSAKLLNAQGHTGQMFFISPSGSLPVVKAPKSNRRYIFKHLTPENVDKFGITLDEVLELVKAEINAAQQESPVDLSRLLQTMQENPIAWLANQIA